ncbi:hypothetical protein [Vibrio nereis]|uniref:hypothetical protein n=1 Tax=Vibrio nereis TaxID=693 RepID=UPI002494DB96|nr:hypothetical protein [Vibrio nereis]
MEKNRANWSKKYGLLYTCRAGWLDLGHLDPTSNRKEIGAQNLWNKICNEGEPYQTLDKSISSFSPKGGQQKPIKILHFPMGKRDS